MAQYQLWLYDPFGNRISDISGQDVVKLTYALGTNAVGSATLTLSAGVIPDRNLVEDARLEIMRKPIGGDWQREGETVFLLQNPIRGRSSQGGRYRTLIAHTANTLLERRDVEALAGSGGALKSGPSDDVMKAYVIQEMGTGASVARSWSAYMSVAAQVALGPSITKDASYKNLLSVLQDIAQSARSTDSTKPVYFDLVWDGTQFQFQTYIGQRGTNRSIEGSSNALTISVERGTLAGVVESSTDYRGASTWVYGLGPGQGPNRKILSASDTARIVASPFGRRESTIDATQATTDPGITAEALAELGRRRARAILTGDVQSRPGAVYGLHWFFGDALLAEFEGQKYIARIEAMTVVVERGTETITTKVKGEPL